MTQDLAGAVERVEHQLSQRHAVFWASDIHLLLSALKARGEALERIEDGTYPPERREAGRCPHDVDLTDDCVDCIQDFARACLQGEKP